MNIRKARTDEADALTVLAHASKAHWGYSSAQLAQWAGTLRVTPASIARWPTLIAECDIHGETRLAGFAQIAGHKTGPTLEHFWVHPDAMGRGIGRALLKQAGSHALQLGFEILWIDADPQAEGFYLACGAMRVGADSAPIAGQPDRVRPQLLLPVSAYDPIEPGGQIT